MTETKPGSRELARTKIRAAGKGTLEALEEVALLIQSDKRYRISYRRADSYLGLASHFIQLALIELRKRKRKEDANKVEVKEATAEPKPITME